MAREDPSVFVMGDNIHHGQDSRAYGPIQIQDVLGKAAYVLWSFDDQSASRMGLEIH